MPGIPPSPSHVRAVIDFIEDADMQVLFAANYFSRSQVEQVASRTGISAVMVPEHVEGEEGVDDYFSLILLTVWFFFAFLAVPNSTADGEWHLLGYFFLASFFLFYLPFSKISHYLYYPFTRYYLGKTLGRRGVNPMRGGTA